MTIRVLLPLVGPGRWKVRLGVVKRRAQYTLSYKYFGRPALGIDLEVRTNEYKLYGR
jgi:hypothetical protein